MRTGLIAKKLGMTRFFAEDGAHAELLSYETRSHCEMPTV